MSNYNRTVDLEEVDQILEALFTCLRRDLQESIWEKVDSWKTDDGHVIKRFYRNKMYVEQGHPCHLCGSTSTFRSSHKTLIDAGSFKCDDCGTSGKTEINCRHPGGMHIGGECDCVDEDGKRY